MNKKYLVTYVIVNTIGFINTHINDYQVFVDYKNNQLAAQIFYERLLTKDDTYSTNIC